MAERQEQALQIRTDVIALPPLKMVLVHAKDDLENTFTEETQPVKSQEQIEPKVVKKLIEYLEKKP